MSKGFNISQDSVDHTSLTKHLEFLICGSQLNSEESMWHLVGGLSFLIFYFSLIQVVNQGSRGKYTVVGTIT